VAKPDRDELLLVRGRGDWQRENAFVHIVIDNPKVRLRAMHQTNHQSPITNHQSPFTFHLSLISPRASRLFAACRAAPVMVRRQATRDVSYRHTDYRSAVDVGMIAV
jgi:hypothetical protein